jgi:hypothetical protein
MTFQPGANIYTQGFGSRVENVEVPHLDVRPPNPTDIIYPIGKQWTDTMGKNTYFLVGLSTSSGVTVAIWEQVQNASGALDSLSNGTTKVFPDATGNIAITGTTNQISVGTAANELTVGIPSLFIPPGNVEFTSGVDFTASTSTFVATGAVWQFNSTPQFTAGLTVTSGTTTLDSAVDFSAASSTTVSAGASWFFNNNLAFNAGFDVNTGTVNVAAPVSWNFGDVPAFNNGYVVPAGVVDITAGTSTTTILSPVILLGSSPNPQISMNSAFNLFSNDGAVALATDLIGNNLEMGANADIANSSATIISSGTGGTRFLSCVSFEPFHTVNPANILEGVENTIACNVNTNAISVTLVAAPVDGTRLVIYDSDGKGATNNITITATGGFLFQGNGSFNGNATLTINQNYGSVELLFCNPAFATPFWLVASSNYTF